VAGAATLRLRITMPDIYGNATEIALLTDYQTFAVMSTKTPLRV